MTTEDINQIDLYDIINQTIRKELMNELTFINNASASAIAERICVKVNAAIVEHNDNELTTEIEAIEEMFRNASKEMGW